MPGRGRVRGGGGWVSPRLGRGEPVQGGDARAWPSECQSFNERDRLRWGSAHALVGAVMRVEGCDAAHPVEMFPALQRSGGEPGLSGPDHERDMVFDMQPKNTPPLVRVHLSPHCGALTGREGLLMPVEG